MSKNLLSVGRWKFSKCRVDRKKIQVQLWKNRLSLDWRKSSKFYCLQIFLRNYFSLTRRSWRKQDGWKLLHIYFLKRMEIVFAIFIAWREEIPPSFDLLNKFSKCWLKSCSKVSGWKIFLSVNSKNFLSPSVLKNVDSSKVVFQMLY